MLSIGVQPTAEEEFEADFICLMLLELTQKKKRRPQHALFKNRLMDGAQNVLIDRYLMDDDTKFVQYFRLSPSLFSSILAEIKKDVDGIPTNWIKYPISAHQKLCITLR